MASKSVGTTTAPSYADAVAGIAALQQRDDAAIHPASVTRFLTHGERTPRAVLYLHGYTDSTQQFAPLGEQLYQRGYNVLAPRLPHHGYRDRLTDAHANLTAREVLDWANQLADLARGLGERLSVIGLSLGGVLTTWLAQHRADLDQAIIVAPAYGASFIPAGLTPHVARLALVLPNLFIWWDPRTREKQGHTYTYPRFATRPLAHVFQLSAGLIAEARRTPPRAGSTWMVTNANDSAVNNALCRAMVAAWQAHHTGRVHAHEIPRHHGIPHDCIDPNEEGAQPALVFPLLINLVEKDQVFL